MGYPTASTYPEISGAASGTTPTEPTITVTGRANGGTYTVSAGARSLSIGNPGGADLETTVNDTSGVVSVTGDATTSPSWTAPSGGSSGEATQVRVVATDSATGLSSEFSFTEFVAGAGGGGGQFATVYSKDMTALTPTTLTSGSQVVDGVTIVCSASGETLSANGLSVASGQASYVNVTAAPTDLQRPIICVMTVEATWGGTGSAHAIRGRVFSATSAVAPSFQVRADPQSSSMTVLGEYNARAPGGTGSFTSTPSYTLGSKPTIVYLHCAFIDGAYYAWVAASKTIPAGIVALIAKAADRIKIQAASSSGVNADYWTNVLAGLYRGSSVAYLKGIEVLEWQD